MSGDLGVYHFLPAPRASSRTASVAIVVPQRYMRAFMTVSSCFVSVSFSVSRTVPAVGVSALPCDTLKPPAPDRVSRQGRPPDRAVIRSGGTDRRRRRSPDRIHRMGGEIEPPPPYGRYGPRRPRQRPRRPRGRPA